MPPQQRGPAIVVIVVSARGGRSVHRLERASALGLALRSLHGHAAANVLDAQVDGQGLELVPLLGTVLVPGVAPEEGPPQVIIERLVSLDQLVALVGRVFAGGLDHHMEDPARRSPLRAPQVDDDGALLIDDLWVAVELEVSVELLVAHRIPGAAEHVAVDAVFWAGRRRGRWGRSPGGGHGGQAAVEWMDRECQMTVHVVE